jgi:hypothetical protein
MRVVETETEPEQGQLNQNQNYSNETILLLLSCQTASVFAFQPSMQQGYERPHTKHKEQTPNTSTKWELGEVAVPA